MITSLVVKYLLKNKAVAKVKAAIDAAKAEVRKIEAALKAEIERVISEAKAKL